VLNRNGHLLYERLKNFEEEWLNNDVRVRMQGLVSDGLLTIGFTNLSATSANDKRHAGEQFLRGLRNAWEDHYSCMAMTTDVMMYMVG
jgi:cullin 3